MSRDAALQFFDFASEDPEVRVQFRSITGVKEVCRLGGLHGYEFDTRDLAEASAVAAREQPGVGRGRNVARIPDSTPSPAAASRLLHYEWCLDDFPELGDVVRELARLKIKPNSVDLRSFHARFRQDDRDFADLSPASPGFRDYCSEMVKSDAAAQDQFESRAFHLINLDDRIDHAEYESYLRSKTRLVSTLDRFFGEEVRFSGSLWYPPGGYRAWHTNQTQPGWRMYLIDFDGPEAEVAGKSFFRYMDPRTGELVTLRERPRLMRFFKIEQERDKLLWHCILNDSPYSRWSFGFMVSESWMKRLI